MVLEQIGRGGQGDVYTVYDPQLDRRVALKRIRGGHAPTADVQRARLMREAQALARLEHPNVLRVYDTGTHDSLDDHDDSGGGTQTRTRTGHDE